jgi:molecular chaperone GrpE (heat shock protein)
MVGPQGDEEGETGQDAVAVRAAPAEEKVITNDTGSATAGGSEAPVEGLDAEPGGGVGKELLTAMAALSDKFDQRIGQDQVRERMFNALHEQMRRAEGDEAFERNKGLYRALLGYYDEVARAEARWADAEAGGDLVALREDLADLLERENIVRMAGPEAGTVGAPFDRRVQQALGAVPADDPALDNTVARVVKDGFWYGERVLRPQQVMVWRYAAAVAAKGD